MKISSSLAKLIDETLLHKAALSSQHQNLFAPKAVPILWFGDLNKYRRSNLKILTVAINPSNVEFEECAPDGKEKTSLFRFPLAVECAGKTILSLKRKALLVEAWNQYFDNNPYEWFKRFMPVLKELEASFYPTDCVRNRVLHVDLATPMATSKPWSKMGTARKDIIKDSKQRRLFERTVSFLKPDLVVVSLGQNLFLQFFPKQQWTSHRVLAQFPYGSSKRKSRLHGFMLGSVFDRDFQFCLFEPSYHGVFGGITNKQKNAIGKRLDRFVRSEIC